MIEFVLVAGAVLIGVSLFFLRSVSHGHEVLAWSAAWVSVGVAGLVATMPEASPALSVGLGHVFGILFPAFLFVGAVCLRRGTVPWWALAVGLGIGALRAVLTALDFFEASVLLSIPIKVVFIVGAAWVVWLPRGAVAPGIAERLLAPSLLLLAMVEGVDPLVRLGLVGLDSVSMLQLWIGAGAFVGTMQVGTVIGRGQLGDQQRRDERDQLRRSEARNSSLVSAIPDVLVRLSSDLVVLDVSAPSEDMLFASPQTMVGRSLRELGIVPELLDAASALVATVLESRAVQSTEIQFPLASGPRYFEVQCVPCDAKEVLVLARDTTERKRAHEENQRLESRLVQARHLEGLGVVASGVAHELNNVLTLIMGRAELLEQRVSPRDPSRQYLAEIVSAVERCATFARQLLAFAREEATSPCVVDLNSLIYDLEPRLRALAPQPIELDLALDPVPALVEVDSDQFEQVVLHLATNARDESPGNGRIFIETARVALEDPIPGETGEIPAGRYLVLSVRDAGVGIDVETSTRAFEPFLSTKAEGQGAGLGLSMVSGIVRQSGGHLHVESERGRGTRIQVYLPLIPGKPGHPVSVPAGRP